MKVKCDNCGWEGDEDDLAIDLPNIPDLGQRLDPRGTVPAGECNECDALVYLDTPYTQPTTKLIEALESCSNALGSWIEIADDEDRRDGDDEAMELARVALAETKGPDTTPSTLKPYSVLLKRPDYLGDDDYFYTFTKAADVAAAVDQARAEAGIADDVHPDDITDYALVLVLAGNHPDIRFQDKREA